MTAETIRRIKKICVIGNVTEDKVIEDAVNLLWEANELYKLDEDELKDRNDLTAMIFGCKVGSEKAKQTVWRVFDKNGIRTKLDFMTNGIANMMGLKGLGPKSREVIAEMVRNSTGARGGVRILCVRL